MSNSTTPATVRMTAAQAAQRARICARDKVHALISEAMESGSTACELDPEIYISCGLQEISDELHALGYRVKYQTQGHILQQVIISWS